jgi:two-component system nitrogen regulation sensor histidine kinase NtrY
MESEKLLTARVKAVLLLLSAVSFIWAGILIDRKNIYAAVFVMIVGFIILLLLNRIYNYTNEAISLFFDSLRNDDTTLHFPVDLKNRRFSRLFESMNKLNDHFQEIKLRNEYNESYYRTLIQHASTGLLVIGVNNRIELINKTACNYAGISPDSTNPDLLRIKHPAFYEAVCNLKPGENITYKNLVSNNLQLLFFRATIIRRKDEELKLVSIQDIRNELQTKELESYRKLISVLTHEIMNLLSPLTSVAKELFSMFTDSNITKTSQEADGSLIKTAINGLQLINEQSNGLISFMNNYRRISKIPPPEFASFSVGDWVEQLQIAFSGKMKENSIHFSIEAEKNIKEIIADKKLLNQVMVNLINNSVDAVMEHEGERKIEIHILKNHQNRILIKVVNNGPVIPQELLEKIFVPFFTTKKSGSGIGLSISQEIMKLHNGSVMAVSSEESHTCFIVEF